MVNSDALYWNYKKTLRSQLRCPPRHRHAMDD
jgi:hypothetical protein